MKCPDCQNPLVKSKAGLLCFVCGLVHRPGKKESVAATVPVAPTTPPPVETTLEATEIVPTVAPITPQMPELPKPKGFRKKLKIGLLVVVGLVLVLVAYIIPGWLAGRHFETKINDAQAFRIHGQMVMKASSFLTILQSNLNFNGAIDKAHGNAELSYQGVFGSRTYNGQSVITGGQFYNKLSGNDLPFIRYNQGIATYHLANNQWYSTKTGNELYKYYCETRPDTKYPSGLIWLEALNQIKQHPSPLVIYNQTVDGHRVTHLRGSIDSKTMATAWAKLNAAQPASCQIELVIDDLSKLGTTYDLWTSPSFDQIKLHLSDKEIGLAGTITIQLDNYNQPTTITAPASALDLANVFAVRAAIQARDYQRRANVDALGAALKAYYTANKTLPTSLSSLAPKYVTTLPHDPVTGQNYSYTQVKHKTFTVSTTLEDSGILYQSTGP